MLSLLRMRLHQAVYSQSDLTAVAAGESTPLTQLARSRLDHTVRVVPIKRASKTIPFVYVCPIAHHLATQSQPAATIAARLVDTLLQADPNHMDALASGVVVQATATGLLQLKLDDRAIAAWLDTLLAKAVPSQPFVPVPATEQQIMLPSSAIFAVQYAHARCCSLLRLAHSEALMTLDRLDEAPVYWCVANPRSIPWLTSTAQLCFDHPADRGLLGHLVEALDCLSDDSPRRTQRTLRAAQAIAQAMQMFHRVHPLWRKAGAEPTLVISQFGLLMATQRILYFLLLNGLNLCPAVEL